MSSRQKRLVRLASLGATALCFALIAPVRGGGADNEAGAGPAAQWRAQDIYVELKDLPRAYTCAELWYRFHDLLLAIGARPYPQVFTYRCDIEAGGLSRSPSVQAQFQLPELLPTSLSRYADVAVERSTIRLGPGKQSFTGADCELLKQMNDKLLAALPVRVIGSLRCPVPSAPKERYALEVQALLPHS